MAGASGPEAGEVVACPRCARDVLQKSMIPVLTEDAVEALICVECARELVVAAAQAAEPVSPPAAST